jgi:hypothetical protein
MKKRKMYLKPDMLVVKIEENLSLLAGSTGSGDLPPGPGEGGDL